MTDLLALATRVAGEAIATEEIEAYVVRSRETDVRVFGGDVESLTVAGTEGIGVRVVRDGCQGCAWAATLDPGAVTDALAEARDNAGFGTPDEWAGVAGPDDAAGATPVELDLWRDDVSTTATDTKVALALELEALTRASDSRVRGVEAASYGDAAIEAAVATSRGIAASARRTVASCASFAMAGDGDETQTGFGFSAGRSPGDLDVATAARDAAHRAVSLLGARQPRTRRLPVVFDPLVTRSLLGLVGAALGGEAVLKGRSMFAGRAGETVAAPALTLVDDPTLPESLGAAARDAEGVPTRRNEPIATGVLTGFLHNVYTGRRSGTATTGSAVRGGVGSTPGVGARALHLVPGARAPDAILADLDDALYVQSVSGLHSGANPVSGDFSVGAEGRMVHKGSLAAPVREITVASTLQRILLDVVEVGSDLTWLPGGAGGVTLVVGEMTMAGA